MANRKTIDELIRENPDAFDFPDCGNPPRETGVRTPPAIQKLIDARKAEGGSSPKPVKIQSEVHPPDLIRQPAFVMSAMHA